MKKITRRILGGSQMNKLAQRVAELEEDLNDCEDEVEEWKAKPSGEEKFEEVIRDIKKFCFECPLLKENPLKCLTCYLNPHKEGR